MCLLLGSQQHLATLCLFIDTLGTKFSLHPLQWQLRGGRLTVLTINLIPSSERFQVIWETWNPKTLQGISEKKYTVSRLANEVRILIFLHCLRYSSMSFGGKQCLGILLAGLGWISYTLHSFLLAPLEGSTLQNHVSSCRHALLATSAGHCKSGLGGVFLAIGASSLGQAV